MQETALITGAAGTIGKAAAQALAAQGYALLLADREEEALAALAATLPGSAWQTADLTEARAVAALFDAAENLGAVVLAAGIEGPVGALEECADEAFHAVMAANATSVWLGLKHGLRILKPRKRGSIVAVASISGVQGAPGLAPYAASKHAVMGLVRSAAREAAASGVRVNAVCPGPVDSPMMRRIDSAHGPARVPMQRYAAPQEVADMIAFLCSDASRYCTGNAMMVDGGITCK